MNVEVEGAGALISIAAGGLDAFLYSARMRIRWGH